MSEAVQTPTDHERAAARVPPAQGTELAHEVEPAPVPPTRSPWGTAAWIISCLLVSVFVAGAWFRLHDEHGGDALVAQISSGKRPTAPALPTVTIPGSGAPGIGDLAGNRPRVVNFWASWCGPCQDEAGVLNDVAKSYRGRVDFIGVDAGNEDTMSDARDFVRQHKVAYSVVRDDRAQKNAWGVQGYPETFVVGTDGRITYHTDGPVDADELGAMLDHELKRAHS